MTATVSLITLFPLHFTPLKARAEIFVCNVLLLVSLSSLSRCYMSHIQQSTVAVSVTSAPLEGYPGPAGNTADPSTDSLTDPGVATPASPTNGVFQRRAGGRRA